MAKGCEIIHSLKNKQNPQDVLFSLSDGLGICLFVRVVFGSSLVLVILLTDSRGSTLFIYLCISFALAAHDEYSCLSFLSFCSS
jgi:hypothetical protein